MSLIPDPAFDADKAELLALVSSVDCSNTKFVASAEDYDGLFALLDSLSEDFNCQPVYLKNIIALFDDAKRLEYDIYYDKTGALTDPVFVIAGVLTDIILETSREAVYIHSGATANRILVRNNSNIGYLLVSGGSHIVKIEIEDGSSVDYLAIKNCGTLATSIDNITADCFIQGIKSIYKQPLTP